jgi:hypothetical protein
MERSKSILLERRTTAKDFQSMLRSTIAAVSFAPGSRRPSILRNTDNGQLRDGKITPCFDEVAPLTTAFEMMPAPVIHVGTVGIMHKYCSCLDVTIDIANAGVLQCMHAVTRVAATATNVGCRCRLVKSELAWHICTYVCITSLLVACVGQVRA